MLKEGLETGMRRWQDYKENPGCGHGYLNFLFSGPFAGDRWIVFDKKIRAIINDIKKS
jgi:hypothetical protein